MHDSLRLKSYRPRLVIRDVILMREKHPADTAQGGDAFRQRARVPGRVDQHVTFRPNDQIARRAIGRLRGKPAEVHFVINQLGIGFGPRVSAGWCPRSPMDAVGQVTRAFRAANSPSGLCGWLWTADCSPTRAKVSGAIWRQRSQSMQVVST